MTVRLDAHAADADERTAADSAADTDGASDGSGPPKRLSATIEAERARAAEIRRAEVDRALSRLASQGSLTDTERREVERLARVLTDALTVPVAAVRAAEAEE